MYSNVEIIDIVFRGVKVKISEIRLKSENLHPCRIPIRTHKSDEKWPLFVNKQLFWWSASITLDNNNEILRLLAIFLTLYFTTYLSVDQNGCISIVFFSLNILTHLTTILPVGSL